MNEAFKRRSFGGSQFETNDECPVPAFGNPLGNHGWIKCNSKSFPGTNYYFNVDTSCSTWGRPVPKFIPTPYHRQPSLWKHEESLDEAPIEVSDIEDDEDEDVDENSDLNNVNVDKKPLIVKAKEARRKKLFAEVLFKLYHGYGEDFCTNQFDVSTPFATNDELPLIKNEPIEDESTDNYQPILPEICYSSSSDGELTDSGSKKNRERSDSLGSASTIVVKHRQNSESSVDDSAIFSDCESFVKVSNNEYDPLSLGDSFEARMKIEEYDKTSRISVSSFEDCDEGSRQIGLSSEDDEGDGGESDEEEEGEEDEEEETDEYEEDGEEDDNNNAKNGECRYSLVKLKPIEFSDLITEPPKVRSVKRKVSRKRKSTKLIKTEENSRKSPPKKITKMICELNGVKTVNYDFIIPELPAGVKMSNLSDSGSSTFHDNWYSLYETIKSEKHSIDEKIKVEKSFDFGDIYLNIHEPDLSDSSTSRSVSSRKTVSNNCCSKNGNESDSSESSTSSSSSAISRDEIKNILNSTCGKIQCDSDSSESLSSSWNSSWSSSSCSAKSLEKKIKSLPPATSFTIKKEKLDENESPVVNPSERIVRRRSLRACANVQYVTFFD